jgi:hypothetical protein
MGYSAQEMVDAIVAAVAQRGADGWGKDGLDGYMFMLASTSFRRFGILLGRTLWSKMQPGRDKDDGPDFLTAEEMRAKLREAGLPERVLDYLPRVHARTVPADRRERAQPNGTRVIGEAVINAARRHGSDGRGKDGLLGYLLLLERIEPPTFDTLTRMAQRWQVKHPPRPPKRELDPSLAERDRAMERWGPDNEDLDWDPYDDPEVMTSA